MVQWIVFVSWILSQCAKARCAWMHKEWDKVSDTPSENKSMARLLGDQGALSRQWGLVYGEARCFIIKWWKCIGANKVGMTRHMRQGASCLGVVQGARYSRGLFVACKSLERLIWGETLRLGTIVVGL
jgi:hypothetical protein